ncbi:hypothetical protein JFV29_11990 [Peribacillus sp. TH16]|uniref:hypothetical protein n=1 Tax=Peribacillus sp. TH16 TaxID=2798482 RepID=UPI0019140218|nr:hypothetical protein [Peribacillus sp. TH16]MBK5482613.1 hypothetical protein [Peribacillus sp. TH16]
MVQYHYIIKKLLDAGFIQLFEHKNDRRKTYIATQKGKMMLMNKIERRRKMVELENHLLGGDR